MPYGIRRLFATDHARAAVFSAAALLVSAVVLWTTWHLQRQTNWLDLRIYRNAIGYWIHGGQLYDYVQPHTRNRLGFTYPPFGALVLDPLTWVSQRTAEWTFTGLNVTICCIAGGGFAVSLARRFALPRWSAAVLGASLVLGLEPVRESLGFGQINLVLLALVLVDMWLLSTGRRHGGYAIGLAAAIKLTPFVLILALLGARRQASAARAALTFAIATIAAAFVAPGTSWRYWTTEVWQTSRVGRPSRISNQAWSGAVARFERTAEPSTLLWLLGAMAAVAVAVWFARRATGWWPIVRVLTVACAAATMASPISWTHHFVWSVPAIAALIYHASRTRTATSIGAAVVVYLMFCLGPRAAGRLTDVFGHWTITASTDLYLYATVITCAVLIFGRDPDSPGDPQRTMIGRLRRSLRAASR